VIHICVRLQVGTDRLSSTKDQRSNKIIDAFFSQMSDHLQILSNGPCPNSGCTHQVGDGPHKLLLTSTSFNCHLPQ
jgi:hypothetical protein